MTSNNRTIIREGSIAQTKNKGKRNLLLIQSKSGSRYKYQTCLKIVIYFKKKPRELKVANINQTE